VKPEASPLKRPKHVRRASKSKARRPEWGRQMEAIVERDNLRKALAQVKRNKGAAGIDGVSFEALGPLPERTLAHDPGSIA
jgi:RNA-directed DNA polymerase